MSNQPFLSVHSASAASGTASVSDRGRGIRDRSASVPSATSVSVSDLRGGGPDRDCADQQQADRPHSVTESEIQPATIIFTDGINNWYSKFAAKSLYIKKYDDMKRLSKQRASYDDAYRISVQTEKNSIYGEILLDIIMVRVLIILPFLTSFLSLLLIGLHFDGYPINLWLCALPVLFLFAYIVLCIGLTKYVKAKQFSAKSWFYGLWNSLNSPFKLLFIEGGVVNARRMYPRCNCGGRVAPFTPGVTGVIVTFVLLLVQIVLITLKLSSIDSSSDLCGQLTGLTWGVVFVPIWCLFALYCFLPLFRVVHEPPLFLSGLILLWMPFFISMVCLTVKLTAAYASCSSSSSTSGTASSDSDIRLAYIFMPFWVIEGIVIVFAALFLFVGHKR